MKRGVALIGVPSSLGGLPRGAEYAPAALRGRGLLSRLRALGIEAVDLGDVPVPSGIPDGLRPGRLEPVERLARAVAQRCAQALQRQMAPLVMGGDHSFAVGSIAASAQMEPDLGLVWIDAHPDFNTPETSPSGNLHGMVLAIVAGWGPAPLAQLLGFAPMVPPERIVVIGARAIDPGERRNLRRAGIRVFDGEYLGRHGVRPTVEKAMAHLAENGARSVHLSIDLDVLDPKRWPGVSTPALGGLSAADLVLAVGGVAETADVVALDLAELTPPQDPDGATAEAAIQAVEALASRLRALGRTRAVLSRPHERRVA